MAGFEVVRIRLDPRRSKPGKLLLTYFDLIAIGFVSKSIVISHFASTPGDTGNFALNLRRSITSRDF
jgi:hypothetical protein